MLINGIIWYKKVVEKLAWKHEVSTEEVEEVFAGQPRYEFVQQGRYEGENLYAACGQTNAGRYLSVFFIYKTTREALVVSAREMSIRERKRYAKK